MGKRIGAACIAIFLLLLAAAPLWAQARPSRAKRRPTVAEAQAFMSQVEKRLNDLAVKSNRASWVQSNFITDDTEALSADANEKLIAATTELVEAAKRFDGLKLPPDLARKFKLLRLSLTLPAPRDPAEREELTKIAASLEAAYGKAKYCPKGKECLDITAIERVMAASRDPNELLDLWVGWRNISPPMRQPYVRFVNLSNKGAREMGFSNVGALWRSNYDMPPDEFIQEVERLWQQVRPLYESLHANVRAFWFAINKLNRQRAE